ncbi:unnamed protein product [Lactuca virosa]|uniref:Translocon-associated protein subunit beta n=1 Tax=Lactuca virosa TaxID=75947 RepID=A0AAU9LHN7_9ASTR|nr:unnamed protein product [Lactuca virosa]
MAKFTTMVSLLSIAVVLLIASTVNAGSDAPFIVAHKKATLNRLNSAVEKLSVSINIYNQGSAAAYDVSLSDDGWSPEIFSIVSGNTSTSWEKLDVGALLSHSFELESRTKSVFYSTPAVITFRVPTKAALQEAYSTPLLPLEILSDKPRKTTLGLVKVRAFFFFFFHQCISLPYHFLYVALKTRLMMKYGNLVSVISLVVLFVYLMVTPPNKSNAAKGSKKRR